MLTRPNFPEEAHGIKHSAGHHGARKLRRGHVYMYNVYMYIYIYTCVIYIRIYIYVYCMHVFMYTLFNHIHVQSEKKLGREGSVMKLQLWPEKF